MSNRQPGPGNADLSSPRAPPRGAPVYRTRLRRARVFGNIENRTRRVYKTVRDFMKFFGISRPAEFRA